MVRVANYSRANYKCTEPHRGTSLPPGLRRVDWIRIIVDGGRIRYEAVGVGHRLPTVREISLETALELAGGGVPAVMRSVSGAPAIAAPAS